MNTRYMNTHGSSWLVHFHAMSTCLTDAVAVREALRSKTQSIRTRHARTRPSSHMRSVLERIFPLGEPVDVLQQRLRV